MSVNNTTMVSQLSDLANVWVRDHVELPMLGNINTPPRKEFQLVPTNKPTTSILP